MTHGSPNGSQACVRWGMGLFVDERGYTSVAVATALLASLALVFCLASVEWTLARSADVQEVADACALAGSNVVASFRTVAQVVDACILSMGLVGFATMGAGLVLAAVPGAQETSGKVLDAGRGLLDERDRFARSAVAGLRRLEEALPWLVLANSARCARANAEKDMNYTGVALPYPIDSQSDWSSIADMTTTDDLQDVADRLQDASRRAEESKRQARDACERAWRADCVDDPRCLRSRAASLAGLGELQNPYAASPEEWNFGMAIQRSRAYYAQRLAQEGPEASDIESVTDSCARAAFYEYALDEVNGAWYVELDDGSVDLMLPHLARGAQEMRQTWLYTDASWPCTDEEEGITLHSTLSCPGAQGEYVGCDCVAAIEDGSVRRCDVCRMDVGDLGAVASISTVATNGYEHWWQIIVEESQIFERARNQQVRDEEDVKRVADEGDDVFQHVLDQLRVPRPHICPPGAWGCVSVVVRGEGAVVPSELTDVFLSGSSLPAGVAVSAAALAPDQTTAHNNVLARFFDGLRTETSPSIGGVLGSVCTLWGELLVSYGSVYEGVEETVGTFLEGADGVFDSRAGRWLSKRIAQIMGALGLEPADMRLRKPVLVSATEVLGHVGVSAPATLRKMLQALPQGGDARQIARALGIWIWDQTTGGSVTVAELPIPGTSATIPLTIDLSLLGDA